MRSSSVVLVLALVAPAVARAERPIRMFVPSMPVGPVPSVVNSHIVYMNPCMPNGCTVISGTTDARTHHSDIVSGGQHTIPAYKFGSAKWGQLKSCVQAIMMPFNLQVVDTDPGPTVDRFEVMVGGLPGNAGLPQGIGGIADFPCNGPGQCQQYFPDALVFDFSDVWGGSVTEDCATVAQEIAHAWTLDHVTLSNDPMTYFPLTPPLAYHDGAVCGSDCNGGTSPFGLPCSGPQQQQHICESTGNATQDELKMITALFGPAGAKPPDLKITSPANGSGQQAGFKVDVTCTSSDSTVTEVDLTVDGIPKSTVTAAPYEFSTDPALKDGAHSISVTCATAFQATATVTANVIIGQKCSAATDCTVANFICYEGACVGGPMAPGGLGATCTNNNSCSSGSCASDGTTMQCVLPCDPNNDQCPDGFGCIAVGMGGVCWLGASKSGGGCCNTGGDSGAAGSILFGLGFGALLITRRKAK